MHKNDVHLTMSKVEGLIKSMARQVINEVQIATYEPGLVNTDNREEIREYAPSVFDIMQKSYRDIGGSYGVSNIKDLIRKTNILTLYVGGNHVYSAGVYSTSRGGKKLYGIGCDGSPLGKEGVRVIIRRDIAAYKDWYWCEASGAVEHLFQKNGGHAIPSLYAEEILLAPVVKIVDEYHYERYIAGHLVTKIIFGYKNEEIFEKIRKKRDNYDGLNRIYEFYRNVNEAKESAKGELPRETRMARHIIGTISDNLAEWAVSDLTPKQHQALIYSIGILEKGPTTNETEQSLLLARDMVENLPLFVSHRFR
ncbi:MAG: hypothetical protein LUD72_12170 [Bacteroidales bacterium]|nr:hypothetical protein [Bacteroidales bacterium]